MNPSPIHALSTSKGSKSKRSVQKEQRKRQAQAAASARYRERHREAVLEAGRVRAALRRENLKKNLRGEAYLRERERARAASARYRSEHREELALKQRQVRKRAFIKKHGVHAFIQRRFDAPIPGREPESDSEPEADEQADHHDRTYLGPIICDYIDPCLKRW